MKGERVHSDDIPGVITRETKVTQYGPGVANEVYVDWWLPGDVRWFGESPVVWDET